MRLLPPFSSLSLAVLLFAIAASSGGAAAPPERVYQFAVVPQTSPVKLAQAWVPFLEQVSKAAGVKLKFVTAASIEDFETRQLMGAKADFAYANPLSYVKAHQRIGYAAFAHEANTRLKGILVVRADSPVRTLEDLRGRRVVLPAPVAFAAHIINKGDLVRAGLVPGKDVDIKVVSSHDSAYLAVISGQSDAAGGVERTLRGLSAEHRANLRILHTTEAVTPHPFMAHPRVPAEVVARVQAALIAVSNDPANAPLLAALAMKNGFEAGDDAAYADAREYLGLLGEAAKK